MSTKNDRARDDLSALLRSRVTLIWCVTVEEPRVEGQILDAAKAASYPALLWDCDKGLTEPDGTSIDANGDPSRILATIRERTARAVYVLRDLHPWLDGATVRKLKNLARDLQGSPSDTARTVIVLTSESKVPPELSDLATVIDWPLPERPELAAILDRAVGVLPEKDKNGNPLREAVRSDLVNGRRDAAIDAATGLTGQGAGNSYAKSLVTTKRIDPAQVSGEKKRVVSREKVLTVYDPDPRGLDAIGGLEVLKSWLTTRKAALSQRARAFGLPAPKGVLLVGHSGTGKSLTAKAVASAWGLPLLRLDLGALKSKYVGESESNIRKALAVAETVAPCVVWLDEIEKALAGASGPAGDGGVASDALGTILSWMQERQGNVFVVATANDVRALPPELLRKGRFDEMFFVDLPTARERREILAASLRLYGRDPAQVGDLGIVEPHTRGFTGAEIAAIVPDALFTAFGEGERALTVADLVSAAASVVPLSKTQAEKVQGLRDWAKGRARPASLPEASEASSGRALDL